MAVKIVLNIRRDFLRERGEDIEQENVYTIDLTPPRNNNLTSPNIIPVGNFSRTLRTERTEDSIRLGGPIEGQELNLRRNRRRPKGKSRDRSRSRSRETSRSHSQRRSRGRSRGHSRGKSRGHSRGRSRGKSRGRSRGNSREKTRDRSR